MNKITAFNAPLKMGLAMAFLLLVLALFVFKRVDAERPPERSFVPLSTCPDGKPCTGGSYSYKGPSNPNVITPATTTKPAATNSNSEPTVGK